MQAIISNLWRIKFWHQFLIGSVIPYIRINDFAKNLTIKSNELMLDFEQHKKCGSSQTFRAKGKAISRKH